MIWRNWGRTVACQPTQIAQPASTDEVAAVITKAAERGLPVKAVGAGHSFTPCAETSGIMVNLDRMSGVVRVDPATKQVIVRAGTRLYDLHGLLAAHGLGMENMGDVDRQSIAGAISTGTHGTGRRFGGIATQVRGLTLVDGRGQVHEIAGTDVASHAVGIGALGIITEVTLQCVDAFVLDALERPEPLEDVLATFTDRLDEHDHFEFFWFPHTSRALTKRLVRLPADAARRPLTRMNKLVDDRLLANGLYEATCRLSARVPAATPTINRVAERLTGDRAFTDHSTSVYVATARKVHFREMEYAVPLAALPDVVRELRDVIERRRMRVSFPIECRGAAADDRWLSTASGRESGYVAVHRYWRDTDREYFAAAESIFRAYDGRPHWGKMHTLARADFERLYPRFADFVALRDARDPGRVFANAYLDRVLGR